MKRRLTCIGCGRSLNRRGPRRYKLYCNTCGFARYHRPANPAVEYSNNLAREVGDEWVGVEYSRRIWAFVRTQFEKDAP